MDNLDPNQPDPFARIKTVDRIPAFGEYSKTLAALFCSAQIDKGYIPSIAIRLVPK